MRPVGTAESIHRVVLQRIVNLLQPRGRDDDIGIQYQQVFAPRQFRTPVAGDARAAVLNRQLTDIQPLAIPLHHFPSRNRRAIFDDNHLEMHISLAAEAGKQVVQLAGAVEDGDEEGIEAHSKNHI